MAERKYDRTKELTFPRTTKAFIRQRQRQVNKDTLGRLPVGTIGLWVVLVVSSKLRSMQTEG